MGRRADAVVINLGAALWHPDATIFAGRATGGSRGEGNKMSDTPGWTQPGGEDPLGHPPGGQPGGQPAQPPSYPGWSPQQPPPAWGAQQGPGWAAPPPPAAKPGVVPLRPLSVGELLDGAITSMRENPRTMLGLSALVAVISQVFEVGLTWVLARDVTAIEELTVQPGVDEIASMLAGTVTAGLLALLVTFVATTVLTGILTVVVSRAVLGERLTAGEAWRQARPQLLRLFGLTLLVGLIIGAPFVIGALPGGLLAATGGSTGASIGLVILGTFIAIPLAVWLWVRLALATPALMLETTAVPPGVTPRRASVVGAIRRSAGLVTRAWWRTFGILLLVLLITWLVQQVVAVPTLLLAAFTGAFGSETEAPGFFMLFLTGLGGFVGLTITMPFSAAVTVLLYVDRRIRREGLDIELARAAGVTIPGRTTPAPGFADGSPGSPHPPQG